MTKANELTMWTVYERPTDYPQGFVARRWIAGVGELKATPDIIIGDTLEWVRSVLTDLYPWLYCLPRQDGDEPQIVEVWL